MSRHGLGALLLCIALPAPLAADDASGADRLVWHEVDEQIHRGPFGQADNRAEYRIVQQRDPAKPTSIVSNTVSWSSEGEIVQRGLIMMRRDGRGGRTERDYVVSCAGSGSVDLGTDAASSQRGEQELEARVVHCFVSHPSTEWNVFGASSPDVWRRPGVSQAPMDLEDLAGGRGGCELFETRSSTNDYGTRTWRRRIWVSRLEAVVDISGSDYQELRNFVPEPGRTISFTVRSSVPTLFRFELEGSNYPGFATNANVEDGLFLDPKLAALEGRYHNVDPDFVFDPRLYENEPSWSWNGWNLLETTRPATQATVTVTAMDYGAWGRLRVLARGDCNERFEPAEIRQGDEGVRGFIVLPQDEDGNLMADSLFDYYADPGGDLEWGYQDPDFPEDAKRGDGLTALEEYRGFLVRGRLCRDSRTDEHVRTKPDRMDLFVNATDPALVEALSLFDSADIDVHVICPQHYVDDKTRVVNKTLQSANLHRYQGYEISQSEPQHGLLLENYRFVDTCRPGVSCETGLLGKTSSFGPPKNVDWVRVDVMKNLTTGFQPGNAKLLSTVTHELGHALGIHHHGDKNSLAPIVVLDRTTCPAGSRPGTVDGKNACETAFVAERNGENSGDQYCPMKYAFWRWYVPPSSRLEKVGRVDFVRTRADGTEEHSSRVGYRLTGTLRTYEVGRDSWGLGAFCEGQEGTGINALPGERNHAGNSSRVCAEQLRVNDVR